LNEWKKCRKKPVVVEFREVIPNTTRLGREMEEIGTREGVLMAYPDKDFIIKGVEGELYPISKEIFHKTYDVLEGGET
jgi:hypothetical protein